MKVWHLFIVAVLLIVIAIGGWKLQRNIHYNWVYNDRVQSTVCEMVDRKYLKDPSDC